MIQSYEQFIKYVYFRQQERHQDTGCRYDIKTRSPMDIPNTVLLTHPCFILISPNRPIMFINVIVPAKKQTGPRISVDRKRGRAS